MMMIHRRRFWAMRDRNVKDAVRAGGQECNLATARGTRRTRRARRLRTVRRALIRPRSMAEWSGPPRHWIAVDLVRYMKTKVALDVTGRSEARSVGRGVA